MSKTNNFFKLEAEIIKTLKEIYDPEIPVNVYDLGLIYNIDVDDYQNVKLTMTLTAPNCPIADQIFDEIKEKIKAIPDVQKFVLNVVFDPPWSAEMMSEEAKLELGYL